MVVFAVAFSPRRVFLERKRNMAGMAKIMSSVYDLAVDADALTGGRKRLFNVGPRCCCRRRARKGYGFPRKFRSGELIMGE